MYYKTLKSLVLNCGFSFHITHDIRKIKGTEMVSDILDHPVHVQQHKTDMINEELNKTQTQNDAHCVAFYDMRAVTFILPDEMADVSIAGRLWFILIPRLNHTRSHGPIDSHSIPYLHLGKKYSAWNKNYPACCNPTNCRESSRLSLILVASYDTP